MTTDAATTILLNVVIPGINTEIDTRLKGESILEVLTELVKIKVMNNFNPQMRTRLRGLRILRERLSLRVHKLSCLGEGFFDPETFCAGV